MKAGTKIRTRSGRVGIIQPKPWAMPLYELIKFDDGSTSWIRSDLLLPIKGRTRRGRGQKKRAC